MDFFSLKDERTFRDLLFYAGYYRSRKNDTDQRYDDLRATLDAFAENTGVSIRTAQRYWREDSCPKIYRKYLLIKTGYMGEIHPLWEGYGIHAKGGYIFSNKIDNPKYNFTPKDLNSIFWLRERANDYLKLSESLEREKEELKKLQKGEISKHLYEIQETATHAVQDAIKNILGEQPNDVERGIEPLHTMRKRNHNY